MAERDSVRSLELCQRHQRLSVDAGPGAGSGRRDGFGRSFGQLLYQFRWGSGDAGRHIIFGVVIRQEVKRHVRRRADHGLDLVVVVLVVEAGKPRKASHFRYLSNLAATHAGPARTPSSIRANKAGAVSQKSDSAGRCPFVACSEPSFRGRHARASRAADRWSDYISSRVTSFCGGLSESWIGMKTCRASFSVGPLSRPSMTR